MGQLLTPLFSHTTICTEDMMCDRYVQYRRLNGTDSIASLKSSAEREEDTKKKISAVEFYNMLWREQ